MEQKELKKEREKITNNNKFLYIFSFFLIFISVGIFTYYYVTHEVISCTSNPIKFLSEKTINDKELNYSLNYTYVKVYIYYNKGDIVPAETIDFELN